MGATVEELQQLPKRLTIWEHLFERPGGSGVRTSGQAAGFADSTSGARLSFLELRAQSIRLSHAFLQVLKLRAGDIVSIFCRNSTWYPIVVFAASRIGLVVAPSSPGATAEEMVHVLQTLNLKAIVVDSQSNAAVQRALAALHSSSVFPCCPILTWDMDHLPPDQRARSIHGLLAAAADADDDDDDYNDDAGSRIPSVASSHWKISPDASNADTCAFLCFTSGTTRAPKAVMISHRNLIAQLHQVKALYGPGEHSWIVLGVLPFYHITGIVHLLHLPLIMCQEFVVMPSFNMDSMLQTIEDYQCNELWLVPPLLIRLADLPPAGRRRLSHVLQFNTGAAPLAPEVIRKLKEAFPKIALRQAWGMTETCSCLTITPSGLQTWENAWTAGKPVAGASLKIVGPGTRDEEVDAGQSGEILAKGPQVAIGYFNNAEETQKSFRQDGFVVTGDIGRMTADGFVVIIDRIKDLIKVKGVGIAPTELEDAVMRHHAVQDVGVSGIRDARAGEAPRAYVVLKRGISPSDAAGLSILDLVHKVKSRDKWLRGGIAFVASVPKSESGKILRRMLESVPVLLHVPYSSASSASL